MSKSLQNLDYCQKALDLKSEIEGNFIFLAEYLYHIKENQMYEPQWSSFDEFCMELKMSSSNVFKLIQVYKTFILGYGFTSKDMITAGGISSIADILPMVTSRKTAEHWLGLTATLTRADLRKELVEARTGIPQMACLHANTYVVSVCRDCGDKYEIL